MLDQQLASYSSDLCGAISLQVDLTGGYYDAGDNVKFGLPMAFSIAVLSWSAVEFGDSLRATGQLGHALNAIRWGTDYFLKANTGPTELWVQVSKHPIFFVERDSRTFLAK